MPKAKLMTPIVGDDLVGPQPSAIDGSQRAASKNDGAVTGDLKLGPLGDVHRFISRIVRAGLSWGVAIPQTSAVSVSERQTLRSPVKLVIPVVAMLA